MPSRKIVLMLAALLLAGSVGLYLYAREDRQSPQAAARIYLSSWERGDYRAMSESTINAPLRFEEIVGRIPQDMGAREYGFELGESVEEQDGARVGFLANWDLGELGEYTYAAALRLEQRDGQWRVVWDPRSVHPDFTVDSTFRRSRVWPERAQILGIDEQPITQHRSLVTVGIEPRRIQDRAAMIQALEEHLGVDASRVNADLDRPGLRPDWFLPVTEIPAEEYEVLRPAIHPIPGLVFQNTRSRLPPFPEFARHVLGGVGEVTAEGLENLGEPYRAGDQVGRSGLEGVFERRLAGTPSLELRITSPDATNDKVLVREEGEASRSLHTTISMEAQLAAESALEGVEEAAAIVVVDVESFEVRAAASRPLGEFNRAFGGRYPPGSSFKVVSGWALLRSGVSVDQAVSCPEEVRVGGRVFRNFEGSALGETTFREVFAHSCNTGFIGLTESMSGSDLAEAARRFGFEAEYSFPLTVARSVFPQPRDAVEKAAATIGQGRVLASPLHMASVAAAAAAGEWHHPRLIAGSDREAGDTLDPASVADLQELMRLVVSEGTGTAAQVPGVTIGGKTGTAEFGSEVPPETHAWFIGFTERHGFAVLVEGAGVGGRVAAPIAARLVAALAATG